MRTLLLGLCVLSFCIPIDAFANHRTYDEPLGISIAAAAKDVVVKIDITESGHVIIPLNIGENGPFRFLIDTGSDRIVLDESLKEKLNLKVIGNASMRGAGKGSQSIEICGPIEMSVPDSNINFRHNQPVILPLSKSLGARKLEFDGIIGLPLFENSVVQFDWLKRTATFAKEFADELNDSIELPITIERGYPFVDGSFTPRFNEKERDPIKGKFMIDLGSFHGVLVDWPIVEEHELINSNDESQFEVESGSGIGGKLAPFKSAPIEMLQLGKLKLDGLRVVLRTEAGGRPPVENRIGHLGMGFLCDYETTFDYPNGKLYLRKFSNVLPSASLAAHLFEMDEVLDELGLDEQQRSKAKTYSSETLSEFRSKTRSLFKSGASQQKIRNSMSEMIALEADSDRTFTVELLRDKQYERFLQLQRQRREAQILQGRFVCSELQLSVLQKLELNALICNYTSKVKGAMKKFESKLIGLQSLKEEIDELQTELEKETTSVLNEKQSKLLQRLVGKPFEFPQRLPKAVGPKE